MRKVIFKLGPSSEKDPAAPKWTFRETDPDQHLSTHSAPAPVADDPPSSPPATPLLRPER